MTVADLLKTDGFGLKLSFSVWDENQYRKHEQIGYVRLERSFGAHAVR